MSQEKQDIKLDNSQQPDDTNRFWSRAAFFATLAAGYLGSFLGAGLLQEKVIRIAKEDHSAYESVKGEKFLQSMGKGVKALLDPKLWKSNLTFIGTLSLGWAVSVVLADGVASSVRRSRRIEPNNSPITESAPIQEKDNSDATNWREKTAKPEQVVQGFSR